MCSNHFELIKTATPRANSYSFHPLRFGKNNVHVEGADVQASKALKAYLTSATFTEQDLRRLPLFSVSQLAASKNRQRHKFQMQDMYM